MDVPTERPIAAPSPSPSEGDGVRAGHDHDECRVVCSHCWRYIAPDDFATALLGGASVVGFVHTIACLAEFEDELHARRGAADTLAVIRPVALV